MRYLGIGILALLVMGCLFSGEKDGPRVLGYSTGRSGTCCGDPASSNYYAWKLYRGVSESDTFWVYTPVETINKRPDFFKGKLFAALGSNQRDKILDEGDQCLNIEQSGKDTVVVDGKKVPFDIPIEPCLPYLLDKDLP